MTNLLSLLLALGLLAGVVTFATQSGDRVSFVELSAAPPAAAAAHGSVALPA